MDNNQNHKAIDLAANLCDDHNGIMEVQLFMGHDGHNVCELRSYDKEIGRGESGHSLFNAVYCAATDFRLRNLTSGESWSNDVVMAAVDLAIERFGRREGDGIFNSANFYAAINADEYAKLSQEQVIKVLLACRRVVRLDGGSHWMLLPDGYKRFVEGVSQEEDVKHDYQAHTPQRLQPELPHRSCDQIQASSSEGCS